MLAGLMAIARLEKNRVSDPLFLRIRIRAKIFMRTQIRIQIRIRILGISGGKGEK